MLFSVLKQSNWLSHRIIYALAVCVALASTTHVHAELEPLRAEDGVIRDARGATVILRGLNLTGDAKIPPSRGIHDVRELDVLQAWGVNVARLLFVWEAFEPQRGRRDDTYLDYYINLVDALAARHVRVIVDFHQDGFSRYTTQGCGDGFPQWALSSEVHMYTPDNGTGCTDWGIKMTLDLETARCWNDFYAGSNGVRADYLALLDIVSKRLKDHPAVLGYDMLNEPAGDEVAQVGPLYAEAARTLRANDPDAVLFVSPAALTSAGLNTALPRPTFENFVYSPHYYDAAVSQLHSWFGTSLAAPVRVMVDQAKAWNVPLFVGEFGAPSDGLRVEQYMDEFYAQLDASFVSGAQWNFTPHWSERKKDGWNDENFSIVDGTGKLMSTYRVRPYPARIAGEAVAFSASQWTGNSLELVWKHDPAVGETRVFAPLSALFGGRLVIDTSDDVHCAYEADLLYLRCTAESAGLKRLRLQPCLASVASSTCTTGN